VRIPTGCADGRLVVGGVVRRRIIIRLILRTLYEYSIVYSKVDLDLDLDLNLYSSSIFELDLLAI
jgi:hypothetical protein